MASLGFTFVPSDADHSDVSAIDELRAHDQWVCWRYENRSPSGKPTKPPINPRTGFKASNADSRHWSSFETAHATAQRMQYPGVGFVLTPGDEFVGIDLDDVRDPDTGEFLPWVNDVLRLEETYAEVSPSGKGVRLIARGAIEKAVASHRVGVEIYDRGRYLTITQSHIDGMPLSIQPAPRTIEMLLHRVEQDKAERAAAAAAASPPPQFTAAAGAPRTGGHVAGGGGGGGSNFFRNVNTAGLANLSSWVPDIFGGAARPQAGTGAYRVKSRDLGRDLEEDLSLAPTGIVDFGVHDMGDAREGKRTPIDIVMEYGSKGTALDAAFWLCERLGSDPAAMGWGEGDAEAEVLGAAIASRLIRTAEGDLIDEETGEVIDESPAPVTRDFPDHLLRVPGLVGDIAEWVLRTSPRPCRLFAVAAGLATIATLAGRRFYVGAPRSGTNLYMLIIADSGFGKERPQQCIKDVLTAAGAHGLLAGSVSSASALSLRLTEKPSQIQIIDEVHQVLRQATARGSSSQEVRLVQDYCTLWGRSNADFVPQSTTTRGDVLIKRPTLSIFGATVPDAFYKSLRSEMVAGGFLNRFSVFPVFARPPRNRDIPVDDAVPEDIARRAKAIFAFPPTGGNMPVQHENNYDRPPAFWTVPMSAEATEAYYGFEKEVDDFLDDNAGLPSAEVKKRLPDMAKRMALVVAIGRYAGALDRIEVSLDDFLFARALLEWSASELIRGIDENLAETEHQANAKMVLGMVRKAGSIGRSELLRRLDGRLNARDLKSVLDMLCEADQIGYETHKAGEKGGRPATTYHYLRG